MIPILRRAHPTFAVVGVGVPRLAPLQAPCFSLFATYSGKTISRKLFNRIAKGLRLLQHPVPVPIPISTLEGHLRPRPVLPTIGVISTRLAIYIKCR